MTKRRYKLFLISPAQRYINYPAHSELARIFGKRRLMIPLALPTIAALTPDHYDIRIFDESIESIPMNEKPDIVGITTVAATSVRAFQLAGHYRKMGTKVILGGPYASYTIPQALLHCDSVVVGEAEGKWEECLADFETGNLKQVYDSASFAAYERQKPPRWDLVNMKRIFQVGIQASRGCPYHCDFCLVSKTFGRKMRYREIDNVVEEIKTAPSNYFYFVDDNLTINKKYTRELMIALKPLKISWACMSSIDVANDPELLNLMADAGCFNILIGFESLNPESLMETGKHQNRKGTPYAEAIRRIHAAGIHINASFVVGFDHDTTAEFDRIYDFTVAHALPNVNLHLLGAPPGTETYRKLEAEGRLSLISPDMGVGHFPTIHYMNMSQSEIFESYIDTVGKLFSYETLLVKARALFGQGTFIRKGGEMSALMKTRLSWNTLKEYLLTVDRHKRALFWYILGLIRSRKLAIDKGLGFLLSMLGYHRHIVQHRKNMQEYRELIRQQDRGAWKEQPKHG